MSAMIERVARAICVGAGDSPDATGAVPFADTRAEEIKTVGGFRWRGYLCAARAAIAAMREPTEAMVLSQQGNIDFDERCDDADEKRQIAATWRAMIDEALKD